MAILSAISIGGTNTQKDVSTSAKSMATMFGMSAAGVGTWACDHRGAAGGGWAGGVAWAARGGMLVRAAGAHSRAAALHERLDLELGYSMPVALSSGWVALAAKRTA